MPQVETARGPVDVGELGPTLMHEHVFVLSPEVQQNADLGWDEEERVADAIRRLDDLAARGIDSIVDPTVIGLGRYVPRIERIAAETSINIVLATGLYTYDTLPFHFRFRGPGTVLGGDDPLTELFVKDLTEGIAGTNVRAAILKCATDEVGLTPHVERVLRAVAHAHRETGAPITTHTHAPTRRGLEQQRVFEEEGVDLSRVVVGHTGDTTDLGYIEALIDAGSYVGLDRFGVDTVPMETRVDVLVQLVERGHVEHVVLSHDAACYIDWFGDWEFMRKVTPNWHFNHIPDDVLPALRERGITDEQIHTMLVENPRRLFSTGAAS